MNILIVTMTILMLMTLMTYARWDSFRSLSAYRLEFERYMRDKERSYQNAKEVEWYETTIAKPRGLNERDTQSKIAASPRISWYLLLHKEARLNQEQEFLALKELSKRLIFLLFGHRKDFKEFQEKNPNLVDDLLNAIKEISDNSDTKISNRVTDLANLSLDHPDLDKFFYQILNGYRIKKKEIQRRSSDIEDDEDQEDESDLEQQILTDQSDKNNDKKNSISLLNYITLNNTTKVRLYLASQPILEAIFGDSRIVNEIIEARVAFYQELRKYRNNAELPQKKAELSQQFRSQFENSVPPQFKEIVNFDVTKVDPTNYTLFP